MNDTEQLIADLLASAEVIRRQGWVQGKEQTPSGQVCLFGALGVAVGLSHYCNGRWSSDAPGLFRLSPGVLDQKFHRAQLAQQALSRLAGTSIINYNDARERTVEDILLLLEQAAANLKANLE